MKIGIKDVKNSVFGAFILPVMLILPINALYADIVSHLYEAEAPVEGQRREERTAATREALKEVLVRISGRNSASALAVDETLIPEPTRFVQQFRYKKFEPDEMIPATPDGAKPYTQKLWLQFTENTVSKLLQDQGFPVWGQNRPATLVWLVVDDQKQRTLIGNSTPHISRTHIEQEATKLGLPFRLPLLDLSDQSKLQVTDVWGNFEDTILAASQRYQSEAILVGRIYLSFNKTWQARWTLYSAGQRQDWEVSNSPTLREAVRQGLSTTGESLSAQFTRVNDSDSNNTVMLQIKNIADLKTYDRAVKYLESLNIISQIQAHQVNKNDVVFKISSHRGRLGVAQAIALGHILIAEITEPVIADSASATNESENTQIDLVYKLVP